MTEPNPVQKLRPFRFESFGVNIEITSNQPDMLPEAEAVSRKSLLGNVQKMTGRRIDHRFELTRTPYGTYRLAQNGVGIASGRSRKKFFKFYDSMIRVAVGEYAVDRVFMHAGVVGWRGKAIIIPADSFQGKSTLVSELVRSGAEYYSDEFAIFDADGLVHPFTRDLSMRTADGRYIPYDLTVEELGGTYGVEPIPVGLVLLTGYVPGGRWSPKILSAGQGLMEMIPHAMSIRHRPDFTIQVLNNIASRAIIASSQRGTAEKFVKTLLKFVDKHVY